MTAQSILTQNIGLYVIVTSQDALQLYIFLPMNNLQMVLPSLSLQ